MGLRDQRWPSHRVLVLLVTGVLLGGCAGRTPVSPSPFPSSGSESGETTTPLPIQSATHPVVPPTSSSSADRVPTAAPTETPRPTETAIAESPTPSPSPIVYPATGPWAPAGSPVVGGLSPAAVLLADGRVFVLDEDVAELYDPTSGTWRPTSRLPAPRYGFAMVALPDGRVLVTGGTSATEQSLTSSYLFDPRPGRERWTKTGALHTPRSSPTAVLLSDGRVLVLGGYDMRQKESLWGAVGPGALLAGYRPNSPPGPRATIAPPANNGPLFTVPAIATAELFDPASGTWSPTGPMHAARYGAAAVTLVDGRVLVVGSRDEESVGVGGEVYAGTVDGAEIYDPASGRFSLTDDLPGARWTGDRTAMRERPGVGTLVALDDGDALLVGATRSGSGSDTYGIEGKRVWVARSFHYDVVSGRWDEVGNPYVISMPGDLALPQVVERVGDGAPANAMVVKLAGGRVLAAGGQIGECGIVTPSAEVYFPATHSWAPLPPLPEARAGGTTLALPDGTALLIGGYRVNTEDCWEFVPLTSAVRFVPWR